MHPFSQEEEARLTEVVSDIHLVAVVQVEEAPSLADECHCSISKEDFMK